VNYYMGSFCANFYKVLDFISDGMCMAWNVVGFLLLLGCGYALIKFPRVGISNFRRLIV
jgi:hypothetical protein